ncbi:MAG: FHA domain-containing protein [Anaerolineales bacterium]|nr:FHA domain-containing protein [Anaerolineales bacterium]
MTSTCPNCAATVEAGSLTCSRCGAQLPNGVPTQLIQEAAQPPQTGNPTAPAERPGRLALHIIRSGEILPVGGEGEYIVGRVSSGQSVLPDIDLEPFHAYEAGVSRLHARIKVSREAVSITDLGSSNGTVVNEQKLPAHREHTLQDKDIISLGHLSFQALIGQD